MPRIFDNIDLYLKPSLREAMALSYRADFAIGYFNLRGWRQLDDLVERYPGGEECCRVLVGMQKLPEEELRDALTLNPDHEILDNQRALRLKKEMAQRFRDQLTLGAPTNEDEIGLRQLSRQLKARKVVTKLFLRHTLHGKLYLVHRHDPISPAIAFTGSSNLTFAGLVKQGELNVDVLDHDACAKLQNWFDARWNDNFSLDITDELAQIIDESWARPEALPPFWIYLKMAYHLSHEARAGLAEFTIPRELQEKLLQFQTAAVKIAAHHLNQRGGVLIGDVVGFGKTLMATALARVFQDDRSTETLIICPKNLVKMWEDYVHKYRLIARILPLSMVHQLKDTRRYRVVLIDESQNLRNREGKRYRMIQEYIRENESRCIELSATPYNKTYLDLSAQLRLFVPDDKDLGVRPERLIRELGETEFIRRHQAPVRSLAAFEKSEYPDDWRELMRLFLVRRTRTFIKENYAEIDPANGRHYLTFENGSRFYFPTRQPKTIKVKIGGDGGDQDPYTRLYSDRVVDSINGLSLPRYGMGNYVAPTPDQPPTNNEASVLGRLSRAGQRLMGFCRTSLFKRLESGGPAFLQSVERHALRNYIFLHAISHGLDLPLGIQDPEMLDAEVGDKDLDVVSAELFPDEEEEEQADEAELTAGLRSESEFKKRAAQVYARYQGPFRNRFRWIRPGLFIEALAEDLQSDARTLLDVLNYCGDWDANKDAKLSALVDLVTTRHPSEKVLVFTQFADTVDYVAKQLQQRKVRNVEGVTGDSEDPTAVAWRFSPISNEKRDAVTPDDELRVLISTDVLSEGQNLQDAAIVVNYDLPWALVRLVQRAGRVDRIGQRAENIWCYSFMPAEGVEHLIHLRERVRRRLRENAEVVGSDEVFFEDDAIDQTLIDLYNEKAGVIDGDETDAETDLASQAYQIWRNGVRNNPGLEKLIAELPNVAYATKQFSVSADRPDGVLVYVRTAEGNDSLAWINARGESVTESQLTVLKAAECAPDTPALQRRPDHHPLVRKGVEAIVSVEKSVGGQLGRPSGARFRTYDRLKRYVERVRGTLFEAQVSQVVDMVYRYPLKQTAIDTLNRQLRAGVSDDELAALVISLHEDGRLCMVSDEPASREPQIICSMGLVGEKVIP